MIPFQKTKYYKQRVHTRFVECSSAVTPGIIPKVGEQIELGILQKIRAKPPLSKYIVDYDTDSVVWYYRPVQYWIKALNFLPENQEISSDMKKVCVTDINVRDMMVSVLNSSLFYWYFIISSDCRHLNVIEVHNFTIDFDLMEPINRDSLIKYCGELMKDLVTHSVRKKVHYKNKETVVLQEFHARHSKNIIDKIDETLARHYGLSQAEGEFIINFDKSFRQSV